MQAGDNAGTGFIPELEKYYGYKLPARQANMTDQQWISFLEENCWIEILQDFPRYADEIGEPIPEFTDEGHKRQWMMARLDAMFLAKGKKINAYALTEHQKTFSGAELKAVFEGIEQDEDMHEVGVRPVDMSDEAWSEEKRRRKIAYLEAEAKKEAEEAAVDAAAGRPSTNRDDANREAMLEEGRRAADPDNTWQATDSTIIGFKEDIPENVRSLHREMCIYILNWWRQGLRKEDLVGFTQINSRLDRIEGGQQFKVAPTNIEFWLRKLRVAADACEDDSSEECYTNLIGCVMTLTNALRKSGLDWKMVITKEAHCRVLEYLRKSTTEATLAKVKAFEDSFLKIRKQQKDVFAGLSLIDTTMKKGENLEICAVQMRVLNERIADVNLALGFRNSDHQLPMDDMDRATKHYQNGERSESTKRSSQSSSKS